MAKTMCKREIFEKLKEEYLDEMSTAAYVRYQDTAYATNDKGRVERDEAVFRFESRANKVRDIMEVLELPEKWIGQFEASRSLFSFETSCGSVQENVDSIPINAREAAIYNKYVGGNTIKKIYDDEGFLIKKEEVA